MPHLYAIFAHFVSCTKSRVRYGYGRNTEIYVILLYHRTPSCKHVNDARKQLFAFANRHIETFHQHNMHLNNMRKRSLDCFPKASKACQELLKWGCKKAGINHCKCCKSSLGCTQLYFCSGPCSNSSDN